jgi:hypothetical protein
MLAPPKLDLATQILAKLARKCFQQGVGSPWKTVSGSKTAVSILSCV